MEIILISMLTCIAIAAVSLKYSVKKVQAIKQKELDRPDYIRMEEWK
ncbi:hypothetical protein phiCTC2B_22 (endogenous virus) [Clostridium phage phiCTC2B]|nr:hypothetical protein [Clostridium tetani]YP_009276919.1 hypothetical protein phiCT19406B_22 [Clostridium phage phiCT19406B]YP_009277363.1 hypothetical protein phiCTC2B_22 [Clostridium phage phiCTC2B]AJA42779.1 hypothetical protein phiCT19406B_22 [Clostridium phage phiCT19406B]AJA42975.1 hypothetical protein phiCTC2B_22 [Clostridium phage phiCTC2B]